jgi:hypothetical protein
MNLYHCMIEIRRDAHAIAFAAAVEKWMGGLRERDLIADWRLFRRKLGLGSGGHSDFVLLIEVEGLGQLDEAFRSLQHATDIDPRQYELMHEMIATAEVALYRPYPDPEQRERVALI